MGPMLAAMSLGHFISCESELYHPVNAGRVLEPHYGGAETLSLLLTERGLSATHPYGNSMGRNGVA